MPLLYPLQYIYNTPSIQYVPLTFLHLYIPSSWSSIIPYYSLYPILYIPSILPNAYWFIPMVVMLMVYMVWLYSSGCYSIIKYGIYMVIFILLYCVVIVFHSYIFIAYYCTLYCCVLVLYYYLNSSQSLLVILYIVNINP